MNQPASNVTLKHPTGPWWTIYGTAGEIVQQIAQVFPHLTGGPTDFPVIVAQASSEWASLVSATSGTPAQAPAAPHQPAYQAPAPAAPQGDAPVCSHGTMTFRSGIGKTGKEWKAHMCPAPKGTPGACEPIWIR